MAKLWRNGAQKALQWHRERRLPPKTTVDPSDEQTTVDGEPLQWRRKSFEGRNFNDGERVLKDLSAKGKREFRKGGEREFRRVRVSEIEKLLFGRIAPSCFDDGGARSKQLEEYQINQFQLNPSGEEMGYDRHPGQHQGDALFQPLECEPTLQMGGTTSSSGSGDAPTGNPNAPLGGFSLYPAWIARIVVICVFIAAMLVLVFCVCHTTNWHWTLEKTNFFTGLIPDLSNSTALFDLQLNDNELTGEFASSWFCNDPFEDWNFIVCSKEKIVTVNLARGGGSGTTSSSGSGDTPIRSPNIASTGFSLSLAWIAERSLEGGTKIAVKIMECGSCRKGSKGMNWK
ncbi:hypothetical protein LR48_Vigan102s009300 [Vigna angularis]|uniref:Leucine-rich repeat-containing N-terminal plant-type domain-containing protein n=1 Tax=Phaseolus angularis TaxID=3914 RepID=A0A0L9T4B1_PHAAN|nr:hypothetical protein LR48_Vigan102s009300 [Vigna angularis]